MEIHQEEPVYLDDSVQATEDFLGLLSTLAHAVYLLVVDSFKALLPMGILPRKEIHGQTALITGAGSGLGRLMAIEFGKLGCRVILWDVNTKGNEETKKQLDDLGVQAHAYTVDLSDRKAINKVAEDVKREIGAVDVLVNNAGIVTGKKIFECPDELMEKTMAVNANALFFTTKNFLPGMLERDRGHIVTIASMAGLSGVSGLVDYCASKHAAVGYARSLAAELRTLGKKVHTTTVCPYYIDTGMFTGVRTKAPLALPILDPQYVVDNIMEAVLTNKELIQLPKFTYVFTWSYNYLPSRVSHVLADYFGVNETMDTFVGRAKKH